MGGGVVVVEAVVHKLAVVVNKFVVAALVAQKMGSLEHSNKINKYVLIILSLCRFDRHTYLAHILVGIALVLAPEPVVANRMTDRLVVVVWRPVAVASSL